MGILIPLANAEAPEICGGKGVNLAFLVGLHLKVPEGRIIPASEFVAHVEACGAEQDLAAAIVARPLNPELDAELAALIAELGGRVSIRSSATLEDSKTHSFAGQFLTVLNVGADNAAEAVRRVWASVFSTNVAEYLRRASLDPSRLQMAVVVQRQIDSQASGVAMGSRTRVVVEGVLGQGEAFVSGEAQADHWEVAHGQISNTRIANKPMRRMVPSGPPTGTLVRETVPTDKQQLPALTNAQVEEVARACVMIADACGGRAQDCEFAYADGVLYLLQTRDVTASIPIAAPPLQPFVAPGKGAWELEGSHFRRPATLLYQEIFPNAMRAGFSKATERYGALLSHIDIAFVQGFAYARTRPFGAPEDASAKAPPPAWLFKVLCMIVPALRKRLNTAARIWKSREWRNQVNEWKTLKTRSIARHLELQRVDLDALKDQSLIIHFDAVRAHVSAMVEQHHSLNLACLLPVGDLAAHLEKWSNGAVPIADAFALVTGSSPTSADLRSPEARALGETLAADPEARTLLQLDTPNINQKESVAKAAVERLRALPGATGDKIRQFLAHREYRIVDGYDPAEPCLRECSVLLWQALKTVALAAGQPQVDDQMDAQALERVRQTIPKEYHQELDDILEEARATAFLRDERALYSDGWAWGILRTTVLHIGQRIKKRNPERLIDPADLLYASRDEIVTMLQGAGGPSVAELEIRAAFRRAYSVFDAPPRLGPTSSPPPNPDTLPAAAGRLTNAIMAMLPHVATPVAEKSDNKQMRGCAASGGQWEGPAHLVHSHEDAQDIPPGAVLVVGTGSSSFNMLAPLASAVVAEGGGLLSHVAIVCREYRIPCVCGCPGVLSALQSGQRIRVDGTRGIVEVVEGAGGS